MTSPFIIRLIRPLRRSAIVVASLALLDTMLTSLGVSVVLPVFQALLDPQHDSEVLTRFMPALASLEPRWRLAVLAGSTIGLFFMRALIAYLAVHSAHEFTQQLRFHWVRQIGEHYLFGPHLRITARKQGELLNDWFNETYAASRYIHAYITLFGSGVLTIALFAVGFRIHWQGTLILMVVGVLLALAVQRRLIQGAARLSLAKVHAIQGVTSAMLENITNIRDVKLMQAENRRLSQLDSQTAGLKQILVRGAMNAELPRIVGEFLAVFGIMAFIVGAALFMASSAAAVVPMLAFVFVLFHRLFTTASQFMSARTRVMNDVHSARLVDALASEAIQQEDRLGGASISRIHTDIVFENVAFQYLDGRVALQGVDARIPEGRLTFLLGPSGAGKSSLLDLLLRLTEPTTGRIVANGRPIADFNVAQWRRCFGYVSQDVTLFNGSVKMNLQLAKPDASEEEIVRMCRLAGAHEFIAALPMGYDTIVGDRGHSLSGGQRKRVAIARALMNAPSVLILDEATSAFEQSLETEILTSIAQAVPDLTIVQVTHRPHAPADGDWVIALQAGLVVTNGPPSSVHGLAASAS
jgi:ABC-type bacteriocin/lantibiotic exporter with double-glycine peptidase domain